MTDRCTSRIGSGIAGGAAVYNEHQRVCFMFASTCSCSITSLLLNNNNNNNKSSAIPSHLLNQTSSIPIPFFTPSSLSVSLDLSNHAFPPASPTRSTCSCDSKSQRQHQASGFMHQRTMVYTTIPHLYQLYLPWLNTRDYITGL